MFLDHTQRRTTVGRTPLDEWSVRRRNLYLTTHNTHNRQTSMPPVEFEPTISEGERPQTYALDRAATGTGVRSDYFMKFICTLCNDNKKYFNNDRSQSIWKTQKVADGFVCTPHKIRNITKKTASVPICAVRNARSETAHPRNHRDIVTNSAGIQRSTAIYTGP